MIKSKLKKIIKEIIPKKIQLSNGKDLISSQALDSLSIMILLQEIEKEFKIKINMSKFKLDDLRNIKNIEKLIKKYEKNS